MKKSSLLLMPVLAVAILFSSCKKEEEPTTPTDTNATIKGAAFANMNNSSTSPGLERAPTGTRITALIDPMDIMIEPDTTMVTDKIRVFATVDAEGNYTLSVRARNANVPVTIIADDFVFDQVQDSSTIRKVYTANQFNVTVIAGTTTVSDIVYVD